MIGKNIIKFNEIDSTNTYVKSHYKDLKNGTIIQALHQSNGYGRINRIWHDEIGKNLMFSIYLEIPVSENITMLTQMAASSVFKTLEDFNISSTIKWPNDVLVDQKKICGILLESIIEKDKAHVIIGIGLNVNNKFFQSEITNIATSMFLHTGITYTLDNVLKKLIKHINDDYKTYLDDSHKYINICKKNSFLIGKEVTLFETQERATVLDINSKGNLVVKINNQVQTFVGSEVTLSDLYQTKE